PVRRCQGAPGAGARGAWVRPRRGGHHRRRRARGGLPGADPGRVRRRAQGVQVPRRRGGAAPPAGHRRAAGLTSRRASARARKGGGYTGDIVLHAPASKETPLESERLTVGVAARLSRYLQVLTQAKKMGRDSISSQEIGEYTNVNATQIRRDLSGFGKFGKRGVGYNIDSLIGEIRAGDLGRAIASSTVFADHGFHIAGVFDSDPRKVGTQISSLAVQNPATLA